MNLEAVKSRACSGALALALLAVSFMPVSSAWAVNPDEMLADKALEARARTISAELRCMVCQNESIDDSNAELARDLRVLVRERLTAGDRDDQVLDFVVARYGEFVLLKPRLNNRTILLWGFPVGVLLIGGGFLLLSIRRKSSGSATFAPLTDAEKARLKDLMQEK